MPGHGEKQSRKREQAIAALLSEPTHEAAAKKAKVADRTLRGWLKEPDFNREYREARRRIVEGAISKLQQTAILAVLTLNRNLTCGQPATEVRAAQVILEQSVKAVELADLAQQVEELRQQIEKGVGGGDDDSPTQAEQAEANAGTTEAAGVPTAGSDPPRPGEPVYPDGDETGQMASGSDSVWGGPPADAGQPPGGQE